MREVLFKLPNGFNIKLYIPKDCYIKKTNQDNANIWITIGLDLEKEE